jgi:hypothetical protein
MKYTLGEFATDFGGVARSLSKLADKLKGCDQAAPIDKTPGRTFICQGPIVQGASCIAAKTDRFTVADLIKTVEGIRSWVADVESKLGTYDPSTPLDGMDHTGRR